MGFIDFLSSKRKGGKTSRKGNDAGNSSMVNANETYSYTMTTAGDELSQQAQQRTRKTTDNYGQQVPMKSRNTSPHSHHPLQDGHTNQQHNLNTTDTFGSDYHHQHTSSNFNEEHHFTSYYEQHPPPQPLSFDKTPLATTAVSTTNGTTSSGNDEMFDTLCEILPYFNKGDANIDDIIIDTIERLHIDSLEKRDQDGNTMLILSCQYNAYELVSILLSKGSDPNAQNIYGETCLHFTAYHDSYCLDSAKLLLQYGANPQLSEFRFGCTSLHYAASMGYSELCSTLIDSGALVSTTDKTGCNPFGYAMQSQNQTCIEVFKKAFQWNSISDRAPAHSPKYGQKNYYSLNDDSDACKKMMNSQSNMPSYQCNNAEQSIWESEYQVYNEWKSRSSLQQRNRRGDSFEHSSSQQEQQAKFYDVCPQKIIPKTPEMSNIEKNHTPLVKNATSTGLMNNTSSPEKNSAEGCHININYEQNTKLSPKGSNGIDTGEDSQFTGTSHVESFLDEKNINKIIMDSMQKQILAAIEGYKIEKKIGSKTESSNQTDLCMSDDIYFDHFEIRTNDASKSQKSMADAIIGDSDVRDELWLSYENVDVIKKELERKKSLINDLQMQFDSMQSSLAAKESLVKSLETMQSAHAEQIHLLETSLKEEKEATEDLLKLLEQMRSTMAGVNDVSQSLEDEKIQNELIISNLKNDLKISKEQYTANTNALVLQIEMLEEQKSHQSMQLAKLQDEIKMCKSNIFIEEKRLEKTYEDKLQNVMVQHQKLLDDLKGKLNEQCNLTKRIEIEKEQAVQDHEKSKSQALLAEEELNNMKKMINDAKSLFRVNDDLHKSLNIEIEKRKELHNKLEDLKGRIRVYARIRPLSKIEQSKGCQEVLLKEDKRTCIMHLNSSDKLKSWEFDHIFSGDSNSQSHIFKDTKELVTSAVDGYNVCICCYGQTGSGKTYTMLGASGSIPSINHIMELTDDSGIAPRAAVELFEVLEKRRSSFEVNVSVNMFELYKDSLRDLIALSEGKETQNLRIKLGEHTKSGLVEVDGARHIQVQNAVELLTIFHQGSEMRSTASTKMNMDSSRSHLIMSMIVKLVNKRTSKVINGKMTLVDLAGSERISKSGVSGTELKEAQSINKSLSALGDVINSLTSAGKHVPYRNHPLTMLMSDSIGGHAKTLMFICCSPADYNASESSNSLDFGKRCKHVTNKVNDSKHLDDASQIKSLKIELARMKKERGEFNVSRTVKGPP